MELSSQYLRGSFDTREIQLMNKLVVLFTTELKRGIVEGGKEVLIFDAEE